MFPRRIDIDTRKSSTARGKIWSLRLTMLRILALDFFLSAFCCETHRGEAQALNGFDGFLINEVWIPLPEHAQDVNDETLAVGSGHFVRELS